MECVLNHRLVRLVRIKNKIMGKENPKKKFIRNNEFIIILSIWIYPQCSDTSRFI